MAEQDSLTLIQAGLRKRNTQKKAVNILICLAIVFLGITATVYKVRYEGGFWTCFREMTVCSTVLTTVTSAALILLNLYEMKIGSEQTFTSLYYWRLSSAVTGMIVLLIVLIGYLPFFSDHPVIGRYDMLNMHVLIPLLTIGSFVFTDSPIGKVSPANRLKGLYIILVYTVFILTLIITYVIPEDKIPYSFLNIRHQPLWFVLLAFVVVYGGGYLLSWMFYKLNLKLSWIWYRNVAKALAPDRPSETGLTLKAREKKQMKNVNRASLARRIIGDILLVLVVLLIADVLFIMPARINAIVLKADYQKIFRYELILCAVLLLFALDVRFSLFTRWKPAVLKGIGWVLRVVIVLASAVIIFFCGKVVVGGIVNTAGQADYAIVLGLALENGEPAPDLLARLDTARDYLEKHPEAKLILTGGNANESGQTEADVMCGILTEQGVPESRLILEDQAETTKENFRNIAEMVSPDEPIVMISSDYHMDRAVRIAGENGFSNVLRLPAPSGFFAYGANMLSEVVLDLNDLTK